MKRIVLTLLTLMLLFGTAGCLGASASKRKDLKELDLSTLFSEEEGYHFENIRWWMTEEEIQEATDKALSSVGGYGADGIAVYNADGLGIRILDRVCDGATAAFDDNGLCYMVSFIFQDSKYATSPVTLKDLSSQYYGKITEAFGEPDEVLSDSGVTGNATYQYKEYYWRYTTPDGKVTELQWAKSYVVDENDPALITLGVICLTDLLADETASSSGVR